MRLLLDTHAFVWATTDPGRLSNQARDAIRDGEADLYLSAVSAYEIDFKREFSPELQRLPPDLDDARPTLRFRWLSIDRRHMTAAARLPRFHRDPWDRIIIAQAQSEDMMIVSIDPMLRAYDVSLLW